MGLPPSLRRPAQLLASTRAGTVASIVGKFVADEEKGAVSAGGAPMVMSPPTPASSPAQLLASTRAGTVASIVGNFVTDEKGGRRQRGWEHWARLGAATGGRERWRRPKNQSLRAEHFYFM